MKTIYTITCIFLMPVLMQKVAAQANKQLSNLTAPTKVNLSLLPDNE